MDLPQLILTQVTQLCAKIDITHLPRHISPKKITSFIAISARRMSNKIPSTVDGAIDVLPSLITIVFG